MSVVPPRLTLHMQLALGCPLFFVFGPLYGYGRAFWPVLAKENECVGAEKRISEQLPVWLFILLAITCFMGVSLSIRPLQTA